jgi:hypothetical protein
MKVTGWKVGFAPPLMACGGVRIRLMRKSKYVIQLQVRAFKRCLFSSKEVKQEVNLLSCLFSRNQLMSNSNYYIECSRLKQHRYYKHLRFLQLQDCNTSVTTEAVNAT